MKLLAAQTNRAFLARLGEEAVCLFGQQVFQSLAERFGYDLAFGKSPAVAIEEEFASCVAGFRAAPDRRVPLHPSVGVKYFEPNSTNLFAVVECVFVAAEGCPILVELIVTITGEDKFITLEEVSLAGHKFLSHAT